jgi:hypothetical protein
MGNEVEQEVVRENNNKGWVVAMASVIVTIILAFIGGWVQINNRISVLEVEMKYQKQSYNQTSTKLDDLIKNVNEIKVNIIQMNDNMRFKADKKLIN